MKTFFNVVVVIPVGPECVQEFIEDTINSFIHYTKSSYKIVLADDSQKGTGKLIKENFPQIDVFINEKNRGKLTGLYITLSLAYTHVLERYQFEALLRMDTDALVIGYDPEKEAIELFKNHPEIGIAGQYPNDYHGQPWNITWPKEQVLKYTSIFRLWRRPAARRKLYKLYRKAIRYDYKAGESVFGGACFISQNCLQKLKDQKLLPDYDLQTIVLEEDHLFAILIKSIGFHFADLSSKNLPFGCAWRGLPASPQELQKRGKKIIHSTRFWQDMNEPAIRTWLRNQRTHLT